MSELDELNIALGFQMWAQERGYDLDTWPCGEYIDSETRAAWLGFEAAHGPAGNKGTGQQIHARIKKSSDYSHQGDQLFPVVVGKPVHGDFVVHGGIGGVYRLRDVNLYVIDDGKQYRLS